MLCFVFGCNHRSENGACKIFRFPSDEKERKKWSEFCKRKDSKPSYKSSRICSCHFVDGDRNKGFISKNLDQNSPSQPAKKRKMSNNVVIDDGTSDEEDRKIEELVKRVELSEIEVEDLKKQLKEKNFGSYKMKDDSTCFDRVFSRGEEDNLDYPQEWAVSENIHFEFKDRLHSSIFIKQLTGVVVVLKFLIKLFFPEMSCIFA